MLSKIRRTVFPLLMIFAVTVVAMAVAYADGLLCHHCGCTACNKVCRLVRADKKITVTCWASKDEDFCLGKRSCPGCEHCEMVCDECAADPKAPVALPKRMVWRDWIPHCEARMYTKHKLYKKTVTKTVPSYKWVVEDLCAQCKAKAKSDKVLEGSEAPPVPRTATNVEQIPVPQ